MRFLLALVLALSASACLSASADEAHPAAAPAPGAPPPADGDHHGAEGPAHFTNLKVLPADISKDQLMTIMRNMSAGLGVRCGFCHVMEPTKDFAADTKKEKGIAREMMKLTDHINKELFTWPEAPKATCYMCHHGEEKPVLKAPHKEHGEHTP